MTGEAPAPSRGGGEVSPRWVFRVARSRVAAGFGVAAAAFWLARPSLWSLGLGAAIGLAGTCLRGWAAGHLEKGVEVTTSGPYRWMRHPLYVGSALLGLGFAAAARHPVTALLIVLYLAVSLSQAARFEEARLRAELGDAYDRYARGAAAVGGRRWSLARAVRNREGQALAGTLAALALLGLKALLAG